MIQLQYPTGSDSTERFPLITEEGQVVGEATRAYCHSGSMALHPVVHLHLLNSHGAIYLQKRSMKKDIAPGRWDTAVGGHVDYGEQIEEALRREAHEELGLSLTTVPAPCFQYVWQSLRERELVTTFLLNAEVTPTPDHDEVDEGRFWTADEIRAALALSPSPFTEQFATAEWPRLAAALALSL